MLPLISQQESLLKKSNACHFHKDGDAIQVTIPLSLRGVTSYFPTRKPTEEVFNSCPLLDLTYEAPIWHRHSEIFKQQEEVLLDNQGILQE